MRALDGAAVGPVAGGAVEDEQAIGPAPTARAPAMESRDSPSCSAAQPEVAITQVFAGRHDQVAHARAFVRAALGPVPALDEAVLLVSELCTNALLHTASGRGGDHTGRSVFFELHWKQPE